MDIPTVLLIAAGLAMDSFSVSVTSGIYMKSRRVEDALKIGGFFGFFQAFMPIIGWLGAMTLTDFISGFDHWIAFSLLLFIGCRMIYDAASGKNGDLRSNALDGILLLTLSVATSIDALAVGISFAFLRASIFLPAIVIGTVTFLLSFFGLYLGSQASKNFGGKIEMVGGGILIIIGVKILLEHLL